LTKDNSGPFEWFPEHEDILKQLKMAFTTNKLAYFNPVWDTEVICDASPHGLGAILVQSNPQDLNEKVIIAFASRALSKLEMKYSQVEREALALIWAVKRLNQYVYGKKFKLYSDAKASIHIWQHQIASKDRALGTPTVAIHLRDHTHSRRRQPGRLPLKTPGRSRHKRQR